MKFSIIVPMYNVERYVGECLESLKRQTYGDFEVLVVDDASTDGSMAVARAAAGDDLRFRFFEQDENAGLSAVRNVGLAEARGEYVLFLDSDDHYSDDALISVAKLVNEDNVDVLFFGAQTFYENGRLRRERYEDQESRNNIDGVKNGRELFVCFEETDSFRPSACLLAVRRALLEREGIRFLEGIIHEDLLFVMQLYATAERAAFLNRPLYQRRMRENSIMTQRFGAKNLKGLFTVAQTMNRWLHEHADEYSRAFVDAYAARTFHTYHVAARYLFEIPEAEVQEFRDSLSVRDRIDFDMHVVEVYRRIKGVYDEMEGSRTYRLGRVFLAFPSWVKSRLVPPGK